jgi:hypothetical protein
VVLAALALAGNAGAATFTVTPGPDTPVGQTCTAAGPCSLREAVTSATANGDTIVVPAGTYVLTSGQLNVTAGVTIEGAGAGSTTIEGGGSTAIGGSGQGVVQVAGNTVAAVIENLTITGGGASNANGGGIDETGPAPLILNTVTVTNNSVTTASGGGGGIFSSSGLTLENSTVSANTATATQSTGNSGGGGIMVTGGELTVADSTIDGNTALVTMGTSDTATDGGGGVFDASDSTGEFVNSTVTGNTVTGAGGGGALLLAVTGGADIANATINANGAPAGGGIDAAANTSGVSVSIADSIVAGNGPGGNCAAPVTSFGYNLTDDSPLGNTCGFTAATNDILDANPALGSLTPNNGGPTATEALLAGSPAIDAGNPSGCPDLQSNALTTDQRGVPRPQPPGGRCDIGAYQLAPPVVSAGDAAVTGNIVLFGAMVSNPDPQPGTLLFEYGPKTSYGAVTGSVALPASSTAQTYILSASGVAPGTYHFLVVASNADGTSTGTDGVFTIAAAPQSPPPPPTGPQPTPPSVTTGSASDLGAYTATLNGMVDPEGSATTVRFQYGTGSGYSAQTAPQSIGAGTTSDAVQAKLTGLLPSRSYSMRLVASSGAGQTVGSGVTFSTAHRQPPASLGAKVTPAIAAQAPFTFRVSGRLSLPPGLRGSVGCRGSIRLRAVVGKSNVARARARVGRACGYRLRVTLRGNHLGSHGIARLLVVFNGTTALARSTAPPLVVGFGLATHP